MTRLVRQKKTREESPGGFVDTVQAFSAGTVATSTHAPLARHVFYVFYRIDPVNTLAQYMGVVKDHRSSKTNLTLKVKRHVLASRPTLPES